MKQNQQDELRSYRTFGLTLLQLMSILTVVGIVVTVILRQFF